MKTYTYETTTPVPAERLFGAIADIRRWPEWDHELEMTEHDGRLAAGAAFVLKPKGGPRVAMQIEAAERPRRFVDVARLPLAKMRTSHEFVAVPDGTAVRQTIEVWGLLGFVWDRLVARKQAAEAAAHTRDFIAFAARRA